MLGLFDEASLEADCDTIHLAGDLVIPVHEFDRLRLRSPLEDGGAAEFEILDEHDAITVGKHGAMRILHDAGSLRNFLLCGFRPLKAAGDALPFLGVSDHLLHRALGTGGVGHQIFPKTALKVALGRRAAVAFASSGR